MLILNGKWIALSFVSEEKKNGLPLTHLLVNTG